MQSDRIRAIGIDAAGRLYVQPEHQQFPFIHRECMEVTWHPEQRLLQAPAPRDWTQADWYRQIIAAAARQGCTLKLSPLTEWHNVPDAVRRSIEALSDAL
jgi:hypothetical protein